MAHKLLKPEITSVPRATWNRAKKSWLFWLTIVLPLPIFVYMKQYDPSGNLFITIFSPVIYFLWLQNKVANEFWEELAKINGWEYKRKVDGNFNRPGVMLQQGRDHDVKHLISGEVDGRPFRVFNYSFSIGEGKSKTIYPYTVFAFKFNGSFPHIYLNNKHNRYNMRLGENLPVPSEFEKQFYLSAPRKYEIEALEIFTPDLFAKLIDGEYTHDIELVDHELIMFVDGYINKITNLEKEFNRVLELEDLLDEKLDRFKFHPIGDMPHQLK